MDVALFQRFCEIAYERAGISLKDGKKALVLKGLETLICLHNKADR